MLMIKTKTKVWKSNFLSPLYSFLLLLCSGFVTGSNLNISSTMDEACLTGKRIHASYIDNPPYIFKRNGQIKGILLEIFEKGIQFCCKDGVQISYNLSTSNNILDLRTKQVGFLPLSRTSQMISTIHGLPYVSLIESPGIAVVSVKSVPGEDLLMAILDSWPILVFIITTISLSGICIWVLVSIVICHVVSICDVFSAWLYCMWSVDTRRAYYNTFKFHQNTFFDFLASVGKTLNLRKP